MLAILDAVGMVVAGGALTSLFGYAFCVIHKIE